MRTIANTECGKVVENFRQFMVRPPEFGCGTRDDLPTFGFLCPSGILGTVLVEVTKKGKENS
jgi:hypothetical protein